MTKNLLSICISIFLTAFTCSVGSRLIWGAEAYNQMIGFIVIGLPIIIIFVGLFYCLALKVFQRYESLFLSKGHATIQCQNWPKVLNVIGYVEVATGTLGSSIYFLLLSSANEIIVSNYIALLITFFIFASGYLLLNRRAIGFYLSLISQLLTFVNFTTENFSYTLSSVLKFYFTLSFPSFSIGINFLALIFAIILIKNIKIVAQPVNTADRQATPGSG